MGERTSYTAGTPNWVDLSTSDLDGAKAFYSGLFGWEFDEPAPGGAMYAQARRDGKPIAGLYQGDGSRPTVWNMYLAVDSADAAAARAAELGATVAMEPFDVMDVGRMAFIQDPQGAFVALWESRGHFGAALVNGPGLFSWAGLVTSDVQGARDFYGALFDYGWRQWDSGEAGTQLIATIGEAVVADVMQVPPDSPRQGSYWITHFGSDDLEASVARARELGGTIVVPPTSISEEIGSFAIVIDPQGGGFSIFAGNFQD